jgi:hypothetical protein
VQNVESRSQESGVRSQNEGRRKKEEGMKKETRKEEII